MTFHCVFQGDGAAFAAADAFEGVFGQIHVLDFLQMLQNDLADVVGLRSPRTPGQLRVRFFP